jgi:ATP-binding cassette subfamily G (WHITE) protein 2 (SNQ2)
MLEAIGAGSTRQVGSKDWADIWLDSHEFAAVKETIQQLKQEGLALPVSEDKSLTNECTFSFPHYNVLLLTSRIADSSGFVHQLKTVSSRTMLAFWRSPDYGFTYVPFHLVVMSQQLTDRCRTHSRVFNHLSIALVVGLTFLNLNNSVASLQYRVFALFFVSVIPAVRYPATFTRLES